jgi:hypothetical protein
LGSPLLIPKAGDTADLMVEINQIQVLVHLAPSVVETDSFDLFLVKPLDLGKGGRSLPWKTMSTTEPIARISKVATRPNHIVLKWFGLRTQRMQNTVYQYGASLQGEYLRAL